jgi:putative integral membrane protein (TIGR02587 family)
MARDTSELLRGLGRAFGGAIVFSLPMLMTMEMWELGFVMDRWRLVLLLVSSLPMLMFLSHYSGFEATWGWQEDVRDVAIASWIGMATALCVLVLFGVVNWDNGLAHNAGKIMLQAIPAALGALLARSQFGQPAKESGREDTYFGELGLMTVGALFLSLNVAPTEEMVLISYQMSHWQMILLVGFTLVVMHGFVYATGFAGGTELAPDTPWWSAFARFTLVGYVLSLAMAAYLLWCFGQLDGLAWQRVLHVTIVLGLPSAVGAAAARLIL